MFEIGSTLREARLRRGYDIARCEQGTKIRGKYLRAMEDEQFDVLPSPTYVRGFLRSYAEFLDLDWQLVLDEYESRFGGFRDPDADGDASSRASRRARPGASPERSSQEGRLLWLALGGVLLVALLVWVGAGGSTDTQDRVPAPPAAAAPSGESTLRLEGVGAGTRFAVRANNVNGKVLAVGRLQPRAVKNFPFGETIWVQVNDPTGVRVTVDGKERLLVSTRGYVITPTELRPAGGAAGGG
jgi:cytoskeletal protein RodZ